MTTTAEDERFHTQIWAALAPVDDDCFEAVAADAPDDDAVQRITRLVDAPLPASFVSFSRRSNGLCVVARLEVWPEPEAHVVREAWQFWRGVVLLGFDASDLPGWASIASAHHALSAWRVAGVAPLMRVVGDEGRIWGVDSNGRSVRVTDGVVEHVDQSIAELYTEQVVALVERQRSIANRRNAKTRPLWRRR